MIFVKALQKMLKQSLTLQIKKLDRPFPKGKKCDWNIEGLIKWRNNDRICWIKSKNL